MLNTHSCWSRAISEHCPTNRPARRLESRRRTERRATVESPKGVLRLDETVWGFGRSRAFWKASHTVRVVGTLDRANRSLETAEIRVQREREKDDHTPPSFSQTLQGGKERSSAGARRARRSRARHARVDKNKYSKNVPNKNTRADWDFGPSSQLARTAHECDRPVVGPPRTRLLQSQNPTEF